MAAYLTPANERSFSGMIDEIILSTGKTAGLRSAISFANATIRECQTLGLFYRDLVEDQFLATTSPMFWTRPRLLRSVRAFKYLTQCIYPMLRLPGRRLKDEVNYFYASQDYYALKGVMVGEQVGYAAYMWLTPLVYYQRLNDATLYAGGPFTPRLAYYDLTAQQWMYLNGGGTAYVTTTGVAATDLLRQKTAMNWLIDDWYDTIAEGTKAKLLKSYNDDRATLSFALYKQLQTAMRNTVGFEAEGVSIVGGE